MLMQLLLGRGLFFKILYFLNIVSYELCPDHIFLLYHFEYLFGTPGRPDCLKGMVEMRRVCWMCKRVMLQVTAFGDVGDSWQ